jgi:sulfite reductase (NADPH) flavoprotein alpha-component
VGLENFNALKGKEEEIKKLEAKMKGQTDYGFEANKGDKEKFGDRGLIYIGKGYVKMGNYTSLSNKLWLDIARSHVILISGKRGSGKSYSLGVIAEELANLPPENAKNIMENLTSKVSHADKVNFAVLGFGSKEYPQFCTFAEELRDKLITFDNTEEFIPFSTVDNQSIFEYLEWIKLLKENLSLDLVLQTEELKPTRRRNLDTFTIIDKREIGETFTLTLSHQCFIWINSGDLLGVYPCSENVERYYSIAVLGSNKFMLVIKRTGLCSNFLGNFNVGDTFKGFIKQNRGFNYPNHDQKVLMIANGTGIAPFLGMLNHKNAHLFWGSRIKKDTELFHSVLNGVSIKTIFSKEHPEGYVQDLLAQYKDEIVDTITLKGTIMICGSLTMLKGVLFILDTILTHHELPTTNHLKKNNQLLIDCY